jgi:hypothetical protein
MIVPDQLARLRPRGGKAQAVHDVVQAALEQLQERGTGDTLLRRRLVEIIAKLAFEQAVGLAQLLLFA